jgi:hypothetical protein
MRGQKPGFSNPDGIKSRQVETRFLWRLRPLHKSLEPFFQLAAREQDAMLAGLALQADVGAEAHDFPIGAAAGMRLAEANDVANLKLDGHGVFSR